MVEDRQEQELPQFGLREQAGNVNCSNCTGLLCLVAGGVSIGLAMMTWLICHYDDSPHVNIGKALYASNICSYF